jgi:hypothetical protein
VFTGSAKGIIYLERITLQIKMQSKQNESIRLATLRMLRNLDEISINYCQEPALYMPEDFC